MAADEISEIQKAYRIVGRREELKRALATVRTKRHVLIEGPVGVGKTVIALAVARHLKRPFYRVDGDERYTESKLTGWFDPPIVLSKGYVKEAFIPGPLTMAMENSGALFINEMNRMPEAVQNVLLPAMDERQIEIPKIGVIKAKDDFVVIATQNPREFVATSSLSEALRDRFELIALDYQSEEEEIDIVKVNTGINDDLLITRCVCIGRATRSHPDIRRGASLRAAMSVALLATCLGGDTNAIREACHIALPTRIELLEDAEKSLYDVIEEIVKGVLEKSPSQLIASKGAGEDATGKSNLGTVTTPVNVKQTLSKITDLQNVKKNDFGWALAQEYPELKWKLDNFDRNFKKMIKKIAVKAILIRALELIGPTKRSAKLKRDIYRFGHEEIDLDSTFEQILGKKNYEPEDIIIEKREKKDVSCALMVDTSLSMTGKKLAVAAVGATVLAIKLRADHYALITFGSDATLLKSMNQRKDIERVIGDVIETPPWGYTNMEFGLDVGLKELNTARTKDRFGVLITDGNCSSGYDPWKVALKYPKLHIIMTRSRECDPKLCQELARLGKGKMYEVEDYNEVPRALYNLLRDSL